MFKERLREEKLDKINYYIKKNKCIIHNGFVMDASIVNKKMTTQKSSNLT